MTNSKDDKEMVKRAGHRRDHEGNGDRRTLSKKLFLGEEIAHKDVGLEQDRRKDARRTGKDWRD
jgi:hypothetical protein